MKIENLPSCFGSIKKKRYMKLSYNGQYFSKQIDQNYCSDHFVGEMVDMKYLEGSNILLFPYENGETKQKGLYLLGFIVAGCVVYMGVSDSRTVKKKK
jgi:hypothetical protein